MRHSPISELNRFDQLVLRSGGGVASTPEQYRLLSTGWEVRPIGEPPHATSVRVWRGESKTVLHISGTPVSVCREPRHLHTYNDWLKMAMPITGSLIAHQGGQDLPVGVGELVSVEVRREFALIPEPKTSMFLVYLSVDSLRARGMTREEMTLRTWSGGPLLPTLSVLLQQLFTHENETPSLSVEDALFEMVASIVAASANSQHSNGVLRARAIGLINQNFHDPSLNADWLAESLNLSRRALYEAAEGFDVSIADGIRARRVRHARMLLLDHPELPLHRVARLCGFGGPDQLSRAFKRLMGTTPGAFRTSGGDDGKLAG